MVICVLAFHAYNKTDLLSKRWIPNTKTIIKAKKLFFFALCFEARGNICCHKPVCLWCSQKPLQTERNTSRLFSTKQHKLSSCSHGRRTKENSLKVLQPNCRREYSFLFFLNNYLFTFTKQSRSNNTNTKVLSCKFFKKTSKVSWNMSHFLTLVYFTEGICWIFGIFKVRRGG